MTSYVFLSSDVISLLNCITLLPGKRFIKEDEEEEQLVDLVLVLDLLINIISKDFLNINILGKSFHKIFPIDSCLGI
jgi:hypothetical protein